MTTGANYRPLRENVCVEIVNHTIINHLSVTIVDCWPCLFMMANHIDCEIRHSF